MLRTDANDWDDLRPDSAFYTGLYPKPRGSRPCRICLRQIHGLRRTADAVLLHLRHLPQLSTPNPVAGSKMAVFQPRTMNFRAEGWRKACFNPKRRACRSRLKQAQTKEEGHPCGCPSWFVSLLLGLEAEAEFELRVLEDRDVVVVLVQHRCNVDAQDEVFGD